MVEAKASIFPLAIAENAHTIRKRYGATEDSFVSPGAIGRAFSCTGVSNHRFPKGKVERR